MYDQNMDTVNQKFHDVLRENGFRVTPTRETIWKSLVDHGGHISADDLFGILDEKEPGIGRMTVYRTLDLLSKIGLIRPIYQGTGAAHYILFEDGHHHHLICTNCHCVIEFDNCVLAELEVAISSQFRFEIEGHLLEVYGRCASCQSEE